MVVGLLLASTRLLITVPANGGVSSEFQGSGLVAPPVKFRYTDWTFGSVTATAKLVVAVESYWSVTVTLTLGYPPTVPAVGARVSTPVPFPLSVKDTNGGRFDAV